MRFTALAGIVAAVLVQGPAPAATVERWDKDIGKEAPDLLAADWIGSPVSLDAVRGNTVVLAFWNADIPC